MHDWHGSLHLGTTPHSMLSVALFFFLIFYVRYAPTHTRILGLVWFLPRSRHQQQQRQQQPISSPASNTPWTHICVLLHSSNHTIKTVHTHRHFISTGTGGRGGLVLSVFWAVWRLLFKFSASSPLEPVDRYSYFGWLASKPKCAVRSVKRKFCHTHTHTFA